MPVCMAPLTMELTLGTCKVLLVDDVAVDELICTGMIVDTEPVWMLVTPAVDVNDSGTFWISVEVQKRFKLI